MKRGRQKDCNSLLILIPFSFTLLLMIQPIMAEGASPSERLKELGITLPTPPAPVANYVPAVRSGNLLFVAGQGPSVNGEIRYQGKVGKDLTEDDGYQAARLCALNILSIINRDGGGLDNVKRMVRLTGFVNSASDFVHQPAVINGASDLLVQVFGDAGKHARLAIGVNVLPFDIAVEISAIVELKE